MKDKITDRQMELMRQFCDLELLKTRIFLIADLKDLLISYLGNSDDKQERDSLIDYMVSLKDLQNDLNEIRRAGYERQ